MAGNGGTRRFRGWRTARVRQPRCRATGLRMADEAVARELSEWVLAAAFVLAILAIPFLVASLARWGLL